MRREIYYNWIEKDFWSKEDDFHFIVMHCIDFPLPVNKINDGLFATKLKTWEVGQLLGGN